MSGDKSVELQEIDYECANVADDEKKNQHISEHTLELSELQVLLKSDFEVGISDADALERIERDGKNILTPPPRSPLWKKFLGHVVGGFALLLWIGGILCFIVYGLDGSIENLTLGIVLVTVVIMTGTFSFYQDVKAEKVLAGFMKLTPTKCNVMRNGEMKTISAEDIVVGDVVSFEKGNKVPADVIMLMSNGVKVDNSSLTGESEPQKRGIKCTDPSPYTSRNVAFYGTNVTEGNGTGVAIRCGDATAIGMIADATQKGEKPEALMVAEIDRFVNIIAGIALTIGITFLIIAILTGYTVFESVIFTIGIIVANVPEGLLATVTLSLTITAERMASKAVLVKNTQTVETLGAVNVICSDKTGTLTQNHMIVRHAIFNSSKVTSTTQGREFTSQSLFSSAAEEMAKRTASVLKPGISSPQKGGDSIQMGQGPEWQTGIHPISAEGTIGQRAKTSTELDKLLLCGALCNHATFAPGEKDKEITKRKTTSDPSEGAILKFCHSYLSVYEVRDQFKEVACIPFNSAAKWMATIHVAEVGHKIIIKGAPERVMERCSTHGTKNQEMTAEIRTDIDEASREVAENGERVMAFAELDCPDIPHGFDFNTDEPDSYNFPVKDFKFIGILSMEDPPRPEVPAAVQCCHEAGVQVVMVTGDHPLTARNIAAQVGIVRPIHGIRAQIYDCKQPKAVRQDASNPGVVVTGSELDHFDEDDWDYVLSRKDIVFARTLPEQKQTIVANFQKKGNVVAVTGDGVNDAPALKKADVGIAMGSGSQVSHDAADMILMDDNFASIVKGIEEGRLIFVNLKKSIAYTLTSNIPEIVPFLAQICLRIPNALTTIMILCIDLGTDLIPAISFSYELPENDIMKVPPRDRSTEKLVTWQLISWSYLQIGVIQTFAAYTVFFYVFKEHGNVSGTRLINEGQGVTWLEDDDNKACCNTVDTCTYRDDDNECMWFDERVDLLKHAQTAFLASIIIMQIACGLACKTRLSSLYTHGFGNLMLTLGILSEICLIMLLVYAPFINYAFSTHPLFFVEWMIPLPFAAFLIFYDECRKYLFRLWGPDSEFYKKLYF